MRFAYKQLLAPLTLFCACFTPILASEQGGYSHEAGRQTSNPDWMASIPDTRRLSELSIPATHDTMSFYGGDIAQTQSMPLSEQLQSGIRALDIRCVIDGTRFAIYHGPIFQQTYFDNVLEEVANFLTLHPGETILMRIGKEHENNSAAEFETLFKTVYWSKYSRYFWDPNVYDWDPRNPTLGTIRGKIVVLQNFESKTTPGTRYGLDYVSLNSQDNFSLDSNWSLYDKWIAVKQQLEIANTNMAATSSTLFANYLSGSGGSFPYFVASGKSDPGTNSPLLWTGLTTIANSGSYPDFPRLDCFLGACSIYFLGTNRLTVQWLGSHTKSRVGIVYSDFPGGELINRIVEFNNH